MKIVILIIAIMFSISVFSQEEPEWELVWSDEFETEISDDWIFETGNGCPNLCGWGNNELQSYKRENATVEDGMLVITAKKENYDNREYTSARMITRGNAFFRYGRVEARIKLPAFQGSWPAFWMLGENITSVGWPECGEIDIMEQVNTDMDTHGTLHWNAGSGHHYQGSSTGFEVDVTDFNVYAIEWDRNSITWFVNDQEFYSINITNGINNTHAFHKPHFIILNMAIGGNWPGFDVDDTAFPARMVVDYVRVYQIPGYDEMEDPEVPMDPFVIEAEDYSYENNTSVFDFQEADGQYIRFNGSGSWAAYPPFNITQAGKYLMELRVASEQEGGQIRLEANSGVILFDILDVPNTGGADGWTIISSEVDLNAATYYFGFNSASGSYYLDWIKLTPLEASMINSNDLHTAKLLISPNPVRYGAFELQLAERDFNSAVVSVVGIDGQIILQKKISALETTIQLPENISKGLYIVNVIGDTFNVSGKVMVR
ncbi:family 16 glycosylhydrolase [Natronoflexus pectinivorans]|uniref:Putative secreted protein (Por secretion system target) n=1 Tax=Natronoflexus pectinivorans TaxID=682526 RepID=A0A4V2RWF7_9BACT|nr:family 16 glycosylhydrolase [Natronoflexus pectinivorans]TCO08276.1 putative secreted protein (Por secretion system target) [Natronoflexus pectinivorans]